MSALLLMIACAATPIEVLESAHQAGRFDGEALIASRGKILHEAAWGLANRRNRSPHAVGATWRWASVTKQVVAVLLLEALDAKKLSVDVALSKALPEFQGPTREMLTLRMLLQHTSGLPNPDSTMSSVADAGFADFYLQPQADAAMTLCAGAQAVAALPAPFSYNNCDFLVLGAVLEKLSGSPLAETVQKRLVQSLGLKSLGLSRASPVVGYLEEGQPEPAFALESFGASGAMTGTARDLYAFDLALLRGRLLKPKLRAELWRGVPSLGYEALGQWSFEAQLKDCPKPVQIVERRGDIGGVQVVNVLVPASETVVILFSNTARTEWGNVWQSSGLLHDVLNATVCGGPASSKTVAPKPIR